MLARDGHNFSSWYQHLQLEEPGQVEQLRKALEDVVDGFSGIRVQKVGQNTHAFTMDFYENGNIYEMGLEEISDGQRALAALYSLTHLSAGMGYTLFWTNRRTMWRCPRLSLGWLNFPAVVVTPSYRQSSVRITRN